MHWWKRVESQLNTVWQTPSGWSHSFNSRVASVLPLSTMKAWLMECLGDGRIFQQVPPSQQKTSKALLEWTLVTSLTLGPSCPVNRFGQAATRKSPGGFKLLPFHNEMAWEHSKLYKWFYTLSLTYGLPQFSCGGLQTVYWIHGLVLVLPCNLNCVTLYTQVCSFIQSIHLVTGGVQSRFRHMSRIGLVKQKAWWQISHDFAKMPKN